MVEISFPRQVARQSFRDCEEHSHSEEARVELLLLNIGLGSSSSGLDF